MTAKEGTILQERSVGDWIHLAAYEAKELNPGTYKVWFLSQPTESTTRYRQKYDFFNFHLMISKAGTLRRILPASAREEHPESSALFISQYRELYTATAAAIKAGESVILKAE